MIIGTITALCKHDTVSTNRAPDPGLDGAHTITGQKWRRRAGDLDTFLPTRPNSTPAKPSARRG